MAACHWGREEGGGGEEKGLLVVSPLRAEELKPREAEKKKAGAAPPFPKGKKEKAR